MTNLMQALRYPWQGENRLSRLIPLALLQLLPIVGQIILVGYGQTVTRAILSQQRDLPRLALWQAFVDGLRLVAVGVVYCLPVFITALLAITTSNTLDTESSRSTSSSIIPIVMIVYMGGSNVIVKRWPVLKPIVSALSPLIGVLVIFFIILQLRTLFTTMQGGLQFSWQQLNGASILMLVVASLLLAIIVVALFVVGVRFAITGRGLLEPSATLKLMTAHRNLTGRLMGIVWLLAIGTIIAAILGSLFLVVPGLLLLVAGVLSIWFAATQYGLKIGLVSMPNHA